MDHVVSAPPQSRHGEKGKKETLLKTNNLRTRVLAALVAIVLVVGTGVAGLSALAAQTVTVQIANIPRGSDNQYSNKNGWTVHVETYFTVKILDDYSTGNAVYCLEPPSSLHTGDTLSQQGDVVSYFRGKFAWNGTLSGEWQRKLIAAILYHGYHGTCNLNTWVTQNRAAGRSSPNTGRPSSSSGSRSSGSGTRTSTGCPCKTGTCRSTGS